MTEWAFGRARVIPGGRLYDIYYPLWKAASRLMERIGLGLMVRDLDRLSTEHRRLVLYGLIGILALTSVLAKFDHLDAAIEVLLIGLLFWRVGFLSPLKPKTYIVDVAGWPLAVYPEFRFKMVEKGDRIGLEKVRVRTPRKSDRHRKKQCKGHRAEPDPFGPLERPP